eukprot:gene8238-8908_t
MDFRIGAVNTDWTNRDESINTTETLGENLFNLFNSAGRKMHVMTLSEVSSLNVTNSFLGRDREVDFVRDRQSNLAQVWDTEIFEINGAFDGSANFIAVPLLSRQDESKHLHISVHLPHKKGRTGAQANLQRYVNEKVASGKFNEVFIHGDFNLDSEKVSILFPQHVVTVQENTTAKGNKDNIVIPDDDFGYDSTVIRDTEQQLNQHFYQRGVPKRILLSEEVVRSRRHHHNHEGGKESDQTAPQKQRNAVEVEVYLTGLGNRSDPVYMLSQALFLLSIANKSSSYMKIHFGRPDLKKIVSDFKPEEVYYCGGSALKDNLQKVCNDSHIPFHPEDFDAGGGGVVKAIYKIATKLLPSFLFPAESRPRKNSQGGKGKGGGRQPQTGKASH